MLKRENDQCNVIYTPEDDRFLLSFFLQLAGLLIGIFWKTKSMNFSSCIPQTWLYTYLKINKLSTFRTV